MITVSWCGLLGTDRLIEEVNDGNSELEELILENAADVLESED